MTSAVREFSAARGNAPAQVAGSLPREGPHGPRPLIVRAPSGGAIGGQPQVRRGRRPNDKGVTVRKTTRKMWAAAAGVTGIALLATACSSGGSTTPAATEKATTAASTE